MSQDKKTVYANTDDKINEQERNTTEALRQAEQDISKDPDLSPAPDPATDLDEGELARLEGED